MSENSNNTVKETEQIKYGEPNMGRPNTAWEGGGNLSNENLQIGCAHVHLININIDIIG